MQKPKKAVKQTKIKEMESKKTTSKTLKKQNIELKKEIYQLKNEINSITEEAFSKAEIISNLHTIIEHRDKQNNITISNMADEANNQIEKIKNNLIISLCFNALFIIIIILFIIY